jgi:ABC-type phosphate transport system substrate-binding protein
MKKPAILILIILGMAPSLLYAASQEEIVIIVSSNHRVSRVTDVDLRLIYLGEKKEWDDGKPVTPVDLDETDPLREKFDNSFLNKSLSSLKHYWIQQILTGRGVPPLEFKTEQLAKEYIASHPGSIGYIHSRNLDSTLKKIQITGE